MSCQTVDVEMVYLHERAESLLGICVGRTPLMAAAGAGQADALPAALIIGIIQRLFVLNFCLNIFSQHPCSRAEDDSHDWIVTGVPSGPVMGFGLSGSKTSSEGLVTRNRSTKLDVVHNTSMRFRSRSRCSLCQHWCSSTRRLHSMHGSQRAVSDRYTG